LSSDIEEDAIMPKTIILLVSSMVPVGVWVAASANIGASRLIVQVICAVAASFIIFVGILRATERKSWVRRRGVQRWSRRTPPLALTPPLPVQQRQRSAWRDFECNTRGSGIIKA
jgi:hypothetical protein